MRAWERQRLIIDTVLLFDGFSVAIHALSVYRIGYCNQAHQPLALNGGRRAPPSSRYHSPAHQWWPAAAGGAEAGVIPRCCGAGKYMPGAWAYACWGG